MRRIGFSLLIMLLSYHPLLTAAIDQSVDIGSVDEAESTIQSISKKINASPENAELYVERGDVYFLIHEFESAEEDYSIAISLDKNLDAAFYGRGMTLGRMGFIKEGINDLSVYIERNPASSLAYTKRGVRHIWLGEREKAFTDLTKAIELDAKNAEAHDDLGVVLAQKGKYTKAIEHFLTTIKIEPDYQKAYHNLAMAYYITENDQRALLAVDNSLMLSPEFRDSLLLKSKILEAMGRTEEARLIKEEVEFLPEIDDWAEHAPIQ